jgi:branched-chain amino acid transport system substrate-binding protein
MSQKNETTVLLLSLLITAALLGGGFWWFKTHNDSLGNQAVNNNPDATKSGETATSNQQVSDRISAGEKLLSSNATPQQKAAAAAIAKSNYAEAIKQLEQARKANRNEPENLIYLNNARIGNQKSYNIAVAVSLSSDLNSAKEILRGVAQGQDEINQKGGIKGVPLKVLIADDDNKPAVAEQVAEALVKNPDVLGVVGHFASDVTLAAGKVYQSGQLVAISPASTSVQLSGFGNYIFRTVPSDRFAGNSLARYQLNGLKKKKAAVFFNSGSNYSKSLKGEFTTALFGDGGQVVGEYDLASSSFSTGDSVEQAIKQKAEVLMLAPDFSTLDKVLQVVAVNRNRLPMLAGDSGYTPQTLQVGGPAAVGMVLAVPWHILADPQSPFPKAANQLWVGDINWRTALAYDATKALIVGIERNPSRTGIQQALVSPDFAANGAAGDIKFLPSGDRNRPVQLVRIQPGKRTSFGFEFVPLPK